MLKKILIMSFLLVTSQIVQASESSHWKLTITGKDKLEFGTEMLAGGLNIGWQTVLEFSIQDGQFKLGTGSAELLGEISPFSRPLAIFECQLTNGIFSNRNGKSFSTPHLRYKAFPVGGKIIGDTILLKPFLDYPGNYYAVLYQCETASELGSIWLERSPRVARELSKQQNAVTQVENGSYQVSIKEVKSILPGSEIELPLIDGLQFGFTEPNGIRKLHYVLSRIKQN